MSRLFRRIVLLALAASAAGLLPQAAAQDRMGSHICDSTLITLLYLAEHNYGFQPSMDAAIFAKGQFAPLFDRMMAQGMQDGAMMDAEPAAPLSDGMDAAPIVQLAPAVVPGEDPACTQLRAELDAFFAAQFGLAAPEPSAETRPAAALAAWQTLPLVNARTGETFTLGDFAGKTLFVEPMATWCSNCRAQLTNVNAARQQISRDDIVFVALSVETDLNPQSLADYADANGFDLVFAVATPDLLRELVAVFGRTITNPPSTPHFIVRPDGSATELVTGLEAAEQIAAAVLAAAGN